MEVATEFAKLIFKRGGISSAKLLQPLINRQASDKSLPITGLSAIKNVISKSIKGKSDKEV